MSAKERCERRKRCNVSEIYETCPASLRAYLILYLICRGEEGKKEVAKGVVATRSDRK